MIGLSSSCEPISRWRTSSRRASHRISASFSRSDGCPLKGPAPTQRVAPLTLTAKGSDGPPTAPQHDVERQQQLQADRDDHERHRDAVAPHLHRDPRRPRRRGPGPAP